jgi:Alkylmercury lyase
MRDEAQHARRRRAATTGPSTGALPRARERAGPSDLVTVCRSARLARPAYRFYRAILLTFAARGRAPDAAELERLAAEHTVPLDETLASLASLDLAHRDPATGHVAAAYPFSGVPTPHRVALLADASGRRTDTVETVVHAMCALDALGIPLMLGRAGAITSEDALTGDRIVVVLRPHPAALSGERPIPLDRWRATWQPAGTVLLARPEEHEAEHAAGTCTAAGACCPITNFFGDRRHAADWQARRPSSGDERVTPPAEALRRAHALFAGVLDRERPESEEEGGRHAADDD